MACQSYEKLINKYVEGLATFEERSRLKSHMDSCPHCRQFLEELETVVKALNGLEEQELPSGFMPSLHERLQDLSVPREKAEKGVLSGLKSALWGMRDFVTRRRRLLVPTAAVILVAFFLYSVSSPFILGGSKSADMAKMEVASPQAAPETMDSMAGDMVGFSAEEQERGMTLKSLSFAQEDISPSEKIIQSAFISIWVEEIQEKVDYTVDLAQRQGGYVESTNVSGQGGGYPKSAHIAIRVPAASLTDILDEITNLGKLRHKSMSGENITEIYYDTDTRVRNLQHQENRLLEILEMASDVEEVLSIETELNRVRTDIDRMTGQLRAWDKRVQFSLVEVDFGEQEPSRERIVGISWTALKEQMREGFIAATNLISRMSMALALFLGALAPLVVPLAVVAIVAYLFKRKKRGPKGQ